MDEAHATSPVLNALLHELSAQGQEGTPSPNGRELTNYPIKGTIDLVALAEAVESALGADASDEEAKSPAELNAANDG